MSEAIDQNCSEGSLFGHGIRMGQSQGLNALISEVFGYDGEALSFNQSESES